MAILTILKEPDERLRAVSQTISFKEDVKILVQDMIDTLKHADGIGLAAPQVAIRKRLLIMTIEKELHVIINPVIKEKSSALHSMEEGCLSIPGFFDMVKRPTAVTVQYYDENWQIHERLFTGLKATCVQHEMDHLNGVLFTDHLSWIKKSLFKKKYARLYPKVGSV